MAKSSLSRREFLKASALGTSALALGSCTSLDRLFMGDVRDLRKEVIILGAGAAGLAAAFELKKRKIPFRVFEASSRVGGRVQSVKMFPGEGPVAELGAEFFESVHTTVFDIAKELSLPVQEIKTPAGREAHLFSFSDKIYRVRDLAPRMKSLQAPLRRVRADLFREQDVVLSYRNSLQFERSVYYDSLSLQDLLNSWSSEVDPLILRLIEAQALSRFGAEASQQSSLHFLSTLDAEGSSLLSGRPLYRMEGGLSQLTNSMAERVAGVIPDQVIKLQYALSAISEKEGVFTLTFKTPRGEETFRTRHVICTVPFSKLREVQGFVDLDISSLKKDAILSQAYATHSKGVLPFATAFWNNKRGNTAANLGNFTGDFITQKMWDSGRGQTGTQGLLTFQRAGVSGEKAGANAPQEALRDLELFYNDVPNLSGEPMMVNWSQRPWSRGSMAYFKPGQYMRYRGAASEPEYGGRFLFAGEHTSLRFAGTLQGALESGVKAASEIFI